MVRKHVEEGKMRKEGEKKKELWERKERKGKRERQTIIIGSDHILGSVSQK